MTKRTHEEKIATLRAEIADLPDRKGGDRRGATKGTTDFMPGALGMVIKAAKGRRMSLAAYLRRSALAMACHDLGVPLSDALKFDPRVTRESGFAVDDPDGTQFGNWEIERLYGEEVPGVPGGGFA